MMITIVILCALLMTTPNSSDKPPQMVCPGEGGLIEMTDENRFILDFSRFFNRFKSIHWLKIAYPCSIALYGLAASFSDHFRRRQKCQTS
jgi:hypothetical protein